MKREDFNEILQRLSVQKGEEKLHIASQLHQFVSKLHKEGKRYAKKQTIIQSRTAA